MKRMVLLFVLFLFAPLTQALTPVEECVEQAEINIAAVEDYILDGAQFLGTTCSRTPKGGFIMYIYTDCKADNYPTDFNNIYIHVDKVGHRCVTQSVNVGACPKVPGASLISRTGISNKDLAAFKKVYRQRCRDWEPPTP